MPGLWTEAGIVATVPLCISQGYCDISYRLSCYYFEVQYKLLRNVVLSESRMHLYLLYYTFVWIIVH
jgi:hypothetical protein